MGQHSQYSGASAQFGSSITGPGRRRPRLSGWSRAALPITDPPVTVEIRAYSTAPLPGGDHRADPLVGDIAGTSHLRRQHNDGRTPPRRLRPSSPADLAVNAPAHSTGITARRRKGVDTARLGRPQRNKGKNVGTSDPHSDRCNELSCTTTESLRITSQEAARSHELSTTPPTDPAPRHGMDRSLVSLLLSG